MPILNNDKGPQRPGPKRTCTCNVCPKCRRRIKKAKWRAKRDQRLDEEFGVKPLYPKL